MILKIGRYEYEITESDRFMDNGACVQLLTQSKEKVSWGKRPSPVLSKRAIRELNKVDQVEYDNSEYMTKPRIFGIKTDTQ